MRLLARAQIAVSATIMSLALAAQASAQELRGTVRDSASRAPIPGVVLTLLDSSGAMLGRGITNARGEYRMVVPRAAARVRLVRIGFRPRVVAVAANREAVERIDVAD